MVSRLSCLVCILVIVSLSIIMSIPAKPDQKEEVKDLLEQKLAEKEAIIWYLGHSGWAIKTKNHLLIFDYVEMESKPAEPSLATGNINPLKLKDQQVFVFVSHSAADHFSQDIFAWEKSIKNICYIFGWQAGTKPNYVCMEERQREKINDMEILTITSTDLGVGFLIKVDGLVIFHAGDHVHWGGAMDPFAKEIDYLAKSEKDFDIVFLAIIIGRDLSKWESITKGAFYAIEKLLPKVMFPMHAGGKEHLYKKFAQEAERKKIKTNVHCAENKGDRFFYQNSRIK